MKLSDIKTLAESIAAQDFDIVRSQLEPIIASGNPDKAASRAWASAKFLRFLDTGNPEFSIFAKEGNIKLPFVAFSTLPFVTCPGMGACESYCYSVRAWRYAGALFRQAQNTVLLQSPEGRQAIRDAMASLLHVKRFAKQERVDLRLYVDGDIDSMETAEFWFSEFLPEFPKLRAYGYSKSWEILKTYNDAGHAFPDNYLLNLSSGSKHDNDADLKAAMLALPVTRGEFVAVPIKTDRKYSAVKGEYREQGYRKAVKQAHGGRAFVCPGQCGPCTSKGHACGSERFKGVPIAIGIH